jgi:hypothetical protein
MGFMVPFQLDSALEQVTTVWTLLRNHDMQPLIIAIVGLPATYWTVNFLDY